MFDSAFYKYHHLTKHTVEKLTANRHFLDWSNQPNPFRFYEGAQSIELPREIGIAEKGYFESMRAMAQGQLPPACEANAEFISHLLFYSMAISAWKEVRGTDHRWALRVNPSSGNLHPTDTHLLLNGVSGLADGQYHYYVPGHALEKRSDTGILPELYPALTGKKAPKVLVCLTSIFWREAWKYQSRAFRYCQHDLGHAMAAIMLSASVLGWRTEVIGEFPDAELVRLLGLNVSDEKPFLLLGLFDQATESGLETEISQIKEPKFIGTANVLSAEEIKYEAIDAVYPTTVIDTVTWKSRYGRQLPIVSSSPEHVEVACLSVEAPDLGDTEKLSVHKVIRSRRSAVDLDGQRTMTSAQLKTILTTATRGFEADFQTAHESHDGFHLIDLYVYAHRVDGLAEGVYFFDRSRSSLLPLALGNQRPIAKFVSCFQDIAADGCFLVSMAANFNLGYELFHDRLYRYVHYEAGLIGQWLYLASTALDFEATGIGCFLDDEINRYLKLPHGQEVIYNFTVGQAILDPRLTTLSAYDFADPTC